MRVLHIGVCAKSESLPRYFKEVSTVYDEFQPHEAFDNGKSYDICFLQIQNDKIGNENTIHKLAWVKRLKNEGCKVINWTGDKRSATPRWMVDFAPYVSVTAFSNSEDVEFLRSLGHRSEFLQIGIDEQIFKPRNVSKDIDMVFMGNNYGNQFPLGRFRNDLALALKRRYKDSFKLYGNGWRNADGNLNSSQIEESKIYNRAKIAISASHFNSDRYTSDRLFRIMGSDICPLVHHYKGIEKDFDCGNDFFTFHSIDSCIDEIDYLLRHEEDRNKVRANALEKSKEFRYDKMVQNIIELCG